MARLALIADIHSYQAGLPAILEFFHRQGLYHLACLGDCVPEMPEATGNGMALALDERVYIAHTRALVWTHFKEQIHAYEQAPRTCRPPLLLCHGHTHVPSVTRFSPPFNRLLYSNDAVRPQEFQPRQACLALDPDTVYLIV